jgi:transposase
VLLGISKRGNSYLRGILIHGARAVVKAAVHKDDALSCWINELIRRRGKNKATVALVNKLARIGWAVLNSGGTYQVKLVNA